MIKGLDIFDMDHTLIRHSSARHFAMLGIRMRVFPLRLLTLIPLYYFFYRFGNMKSDYFNKRFRFLKGIPSEDLKSMAAMAFYKRMKKDIYPDATALIQELQSQGRKVVIATSAPYLVVQPLADYLNITEILATRLEFKQGLSTGRILGAPLFKLEKKREVLHYIEQLGLRPEDCSFYSDSIHDLPLLKAVGNPIIVNPDLRLRLAARRRGWQIVRFS